MILSNPTEQNVLSGQSIICWQCKSFSFFASICLWKVNPTLWVLSTCFCNSFSFSASICLWKVNPTLSTFPQFWGSVGSHPYPCHLFSAGLTQLVAYFCFFTPQPVSWLDYSWLKGPPISGAFLQQPCLCQFCHLSPWSPPGSPGTHSTLLNPYCCRPASTQGSLLETAWPGPVLYPSRLCPGGVMHPTAPLYQHQPSLTLLGSLSHSSFRPAWSPWLEEINSLEEIEGVLFCLHVVIRVVRTI